MHDPLDPKKFILGIDSIDQQHSKLIDMMFSLESAMSLGDSRPEMESIIERLYAFAQSHFAYEEELMSRTDFPGFKEHCAEHRDYLEKIVAICHQWGDGGGGFLIAVDLHRVMSEWATEHILSCDRKYTAHLKKHGIL